MPSLIAAVPALPTTHNGKRSERAAMDAVNGDVVANDAALANPSSLTAIRTAVLVAAGERAGDGPGAAQAGEPAPPGTAELLAAIGPLWRQAVGAADADPEDDFFDAGGTSRAAVTLLRRVKLELGADVAIEDFLRRPTPAGLAEAALAARASGRAGTGVLRAGAGRPLFFLADAWGQTNSFRALVDGLDLGRPVHGLSPDLDDELGRRRTVREVAAEAIAQLRAVQPEGPYSLLGYSFGGLLAYEMACQLRAAGQPVAYVGLIDVFPPVAALTPREARARRWAGRLERLVSWRSLQRRLHERFGQEDPETDAWYESWDVFNAHTLAPYAGVVTYYQAERGLPLVGNTMAAWRRAVPNLVVATVPGTHDDMLAVGNVEQLAARISATLA